MHERAKTDALDSNRTAFHHPTPLRDLAESRGTILSLPATDGPLAWRDSSL
jgi:hypothetical protein